ncbi:MAG: carbonic anhydrase [Leptolyngbya sp.]|nr:carbonic anhydrase [Leptolyngbya sp.]
MERRRVLQGFALGSAGVALGLGGTALYQALAGETEHHWGYVGETGPEHWGELSPEFQVCGLGREQSPLDLRHPIPATLSPITLSYHPVPLTLLNNGHTIQVAIDDDARGGNTLELDGKRYTLRQFHFHHPSEHTVDGTAFPMELHLVHSHPDGSLAVLGVLIQEGSENPNLRPIWNVMPARTSEARTVAHIRIDPHDLLPPEGDTFRYFGSLTTPPCSEIVSWVVFQSPIEASRFQIERFARIFPNNARPVQAQNRRVVLESDG